ncbi:uncharacterized protein LOC130429775 isoform X2 [Triplophysa dalaica]|uniref:uncharacterized protein LOC130429775 isoform X2 n=1 Tax=Triplophysa dalaica TaxID=1582913 RepID=UPI0024DFB042|nr:uncharacterized protein LOC130429775 isoform X2 [Triplophysa dalaica]
MSRWRKKKDHRFLNEFLESTREIVKCCPLQVPIIPQREYPHIPDDSLFLQRAAEVWGPHENIKNVSSNDDVFIKANESVESLFDQEISSDDIFVTAHQNIESLKNESGSIDEVFATEKISREPNRQCAVEWPGCYIRPPVYINLDPPRVYKSIFFLQYSHIQYSLVFLSKKISRSTQTSECQLHISEEPKKKRRRKAIKAFFKKKWKALKRTFTRCTGDSDS